MPTRDIIVIGASAGGVESVTQVIKDLPPDLPAAIFVALHISPGSRSVLPVILSRVGQLRAIHPEDRAPIQQGVVYVAPPDRHLLVFGDHVRLSLGPRENGMRPAIDVLFRSAAHAHGPRVIGAILSGTLDDGSAGLREVGERAG